MHDFSKKMCSNLLVDWPNFEKEFAKKLFSEMIIFIKVFRSGIINNNIFLITFLVLRCMLKQKETQLIIYLFIVFSHTNLT